MRNRTVVLGVLTVAAGAAVWLVLETPSENGQGVPTAPPVSAAGAGADGRGPAGEGLRAPLEPTPEEPQGETGARPAETIDTRSPLARRLDEVADTFLGEDPRVAELLELIGALANQAVVDPESLQVLRDPDGVPKVARGKLTIGELAATFQFEEGVFRVHLPAITGREPLSTRDLQISFGESSGGATGCRAVLQFQPNLAQSPRAHLRPDEERLIGWALSISPDTGSEIRPMSVGAKGDEWLIGSRREGEVRELPWISNTASFDAWLRVLEPHAGD